MRAEAHKTSGRGTPRRPAPPTRFWSRPPPTQAPPITSQPRPAPPIAGGTDRACRPGEQPRSASCRSCIGLQRPGSCPKSHPSGSDGSSLAGWEIRVKPAP